MTLVELLVTAAVISAVLTSLCGIFLAVYSEWDRGAGEGQALLATSNACSRVADYTAQAVSAQTFRRFLTADDTLAICTRPPSAVHPAGQGLRAAAQQRQGEGELSRAAARGPVLQRELPPREQETLDSIRRTESGLLEVSSPVRDCKVLIDGIEIGLTGDVPIRASLVTGIYQLRLEKPGHQGVGARVTMVPAQTISVADLAPKPQLPPVAFLADRAGVEVIVDGAPAGETMRLSDLRGKIPAEEAAALDQAVSLARFDPGTAAAFLLTDPPIDRAVSLRFRGECLIEETRTVSITAQALAGLDPSSPLVWFGESSAIRMRPDVGTLRVSSVPSDADVYIDGGMSGRTPFERSVCSGEHRVRVRHRIGSYLVSTVITRGRTEVVDVTLKPGLAFLGAVETVQNTLRVASDLTSTIDRALAATVQSFRLATQVDVPPEVQRWSDTATAELVAGSDRGDNEAVRRMLRRASDNYDAPILMAAAARGPADAAGTPVDLLVFWFEHPGVDRVRIGQISTEALAEVLEQLDRPADPSQLVYQNDMGMRVADTLLPEAPLLVVSVDQGSPAALAGLKPGDGIASVDGAVLSAAQLAERIREKKPGEVLSVRLAGGLAQAKPAVVPVQRRPRRAGAFDPTTFGNALMAKLDAASAVAKGAGERDLLSFSQALVNMRFGQWRQALETLGSIGQVPVGAGVGPGAALFFRARCHLELGERDRALALLREAAAAEDQVLADDGATVGALARLRLVTLGEVARPPVVVR